MIRVTRLICSLAFVALAPMAPAAARAQSAPAPGASQTPDVITPAKPLGRNQLVLVAPFPDTIYAAFISVEVDPMGKADLSTLQITGSAADNNRTIIREWLRNTQFQPAKKNGIPFRSRFRMTAEALKQGDEPNP
jgi:hypothetical protein